MYMVRLKLMVGLKHWFIDTYNIQYCQILPAIQRKTAVLWLLDGKYSVELILGL